MSNAEEAICALEKALADKIGPIAKHIVKKQINDMGEARESFPMEKFQELIKRSVDCGVYDPEMKRKLTSELRRACQ